MHTLNTIPTSMHSDQVAQSGTYKRLVLAIATTGRPEVVARTMGEIATQIRQPDLFVVSIADEADVDREFVEALPFPTSVRIGPRAASSQRNRVLEIIEAGDLLLFLDDDFLMAPDYLQNLELIMNANPDIAVMTGTVLADGISTVGFKYEDGLEMLKKSESYDAPVTLEPVYNGYGCNMAFRAQHIVENNLRFDDDLPLYSWLEDVDFSRQMARFGKVMKSNKIRGVHLGTKGGRTSGVRLGYSQISNPVHLMRKGTMKNSRALTMMRRNLTANLGKTLRPEPWVDRKGRLWGNMLGLLDLITGRLNPTKILQL